MSDTTPEDKFHPEDCSGCVWCLPNSEPTPYKPCTSFMGESCEDVQRDCVCYLNKRLDEWEALATRLAGALEHALEVLDHEDNHEAGATCSACFIEGTYMTPALAEFRNMKGTK